MRVRATVPVHAVASPWSSSAFGAWLGGLVVDHGPGLAAPGPTAAIVPLDGNGVALIAHGRERH